MVARGEPSPPRTKCPGGRPLLLWGLLMARYSIVLTKGLTTAAPGMIYNPSGARRFAIYDVMYGCADVPADLSTYLTVTRILASGTGTAVTPQALDPNDPAPNTLALQQTGGGSWVNLGLLNVRTLRRQTFRWVTSVKTSALIVPAVVDNGFGFVDAFGGSSGTGAGHPITVTAHFEER